MWKRLKSWFFSISDVNLPSWYKPIDPTLQEFLKQYHVSTESSGTVGDDDATGKRKKHHKLPRVLRRKYANLCPCYDIPYQTHLGSCTLLKRTLGSKMKYSTSTNVIFVNFSRYNLKLSVTTIATSINGFSLGVMGNSIELDVNKTEPQTQSIILKPILFKHGFVGNVRDDERILKHFSRRSIKASSNKAYLVIPKCLASSTVQIDPCSRAYYLTIDVVDDKGNVERTLMKDILHRSCYDVIFNDENIDKDFNVIIYRQLKDILKTLEHEDNQKGRQIHKVKKELKLHDEKIARMSASERQKYIDA